MFGFLNILALRSFIIKSPKNIKITIDLIPSRQFKLKTFDNIKSLNEQSIVNARIIITKKLVKIEIYLIRLIPKKFK